MGAGRPPTYKTVEEMQTVINRYFDSCKIIAKDKEGNIVLDANNEPAKITIKPVTITGLALALGFTSRQALLNYQAKEEFVDAIMRAKFMCEDYAVERLYDKDGVQGAKFNLTNNHSWIDKQAVESTNTNINIDTDMDLFFSKATDEEKTRADQMSWTEIQAIINRK